MEIIFREQADFYSVMRINDLPENFLKKLVVVKPLGEEKPLTVTETIKKCLKEMKRYVNESAIQKALVIDVGREGASFYSLKLNDEELADCYELAKEYGLGNRDEIISFIIGTNCKKTERPALEVFEEAMNNVMPVLEVKARRIGGATYQVPIEVRPDRRQALGLRWLTTFSRNRGEKTMEERLANEIMDAANNTGASVKRKEDMHKMAEANKAFAHYRF